jgi:hypothetical protein
MKKIGKLNFRYQPFWNKLSTRDWPNSSGKSVTSGNVIISHFGKSFTQNRLDRHLLAFIQAVALIPYNESSKFFSFDG